MPDTPSGGGGRKDSFGFLSRKLGPAPVWLWAALAIGAYYLYTRYKSGSTAGSTAVAGADAVDPATGITYAQELSDAEDQITQLQAQVNQQSQGQTAPDVTNITVNDQDVTTPGPKPPKPPKPEREKKIPDVAGNDAARAISTVEAAGFETHTNPYRDPAKSYVATGTRPSGEAPEGSTVIIDVKESGKGATTKAKRRGKPRRKAPAYNPGGPIRLVKPKPATAPARRAA